MATFAIVASGFAGAYHAVARTRARGLLIIVARMYEDILTPQMNRYLPGTFDQAYQSEFRSQFAGLTDGKAIPAYPNLPRSLDRWRRLAYLSSAIPPNLVVGRFLATDLAQHLAVAMPAPAFKNVCANLEQSFRAFCAAQTDAFHRQSLKVSTVFGLLLAFVFDVDAVTLFFAFSDGPAPTATGWSFLGKVISGFLIGLGAPYWIDLAKQLTGVRRQVAQLETQSANVASRHVAQTQGDLLRMQHLLIEAGFGPAMGGKTWTNGQMDAVTVDSLNRFLDSEGATDEDKVRMRQAPAEVIELLSARTAG